ncbi:DsbA family protein (plasmid) [Halorientalis pallida]|uniref:DsbA family protein n=1 Tax=Halorientalis pallida TaxID=2479928 RepID=UPI003C6EE1E2
MSEEHCPVCDEEFTENTAARDHCWDAHKACHHCGRQFTDRSALYTHWLSDHEAVLSEDSRKRAEKKVGSLTLCPNCEERFNSESSVRDHAWDAHDSCHHCGDQFDDESALHAHWVSIHDDVLDESDRRQAEATVEQFSFSERLDKLGPREASTGVHVSRRAMLGGGAAAAVGLLGAGAVSGLFGGGSGDQALDDHPAATNLSSQPTLGPEPGTASGTIIAFEDPSCSSCRRFETSVFPQLQSQLIEPGDVSFVFRPLAVVYPWGEPATHALEAVQARDGATFWELKDYYYQNQGRFSTGNVVEETRLYLAEQTDVDADAVAQDVREGTYSDEVESTIQTSQNAGVSGTPTFFLFSGGSFTTKLVGPQSYSVFANTLGV